MKINTVSIHSLLRLWLHQNDICNMFHLTIGLGVGPETVSLCMTVVRLISLLGLMVGVGDLHAVVIWRKLGKKLLIVCEVLGGSRFFTGLVRTVRVIFPTLQTSLKTVEVPINQVTKHAEFPQTLYIDKVVDLPVVLQRQVPLIQTSLKTVAVSPTQFVGRVVKAPVIMQMRQCLMTRSRSASRSVYTNRPSINQVTKHAETPQILFIDKVVGMPVVMQRQVPRIQTVLMTMEGPPTQFVGRVMEAPMACVRWHATKKRPRTTHVTNVASTATSENVPAQAARLPRKARRRCGRGRHWW